jgi:hypothetical protein
MLDRYGVALARGWLVAGHSESWGRALTSREGDTLVAFEVEPGQAFDQSPGPRAGSALGGAQ